MDEFKAGQYVRYIDKSNSAFPSVFNQNAVYQIEEAIGGWITLKEPRHGCSAGCFEPWTARRGDVVRIVGVDDTTQIVESVISDRVWLTNGNLYQRESVRPILGTEPANLAALKPIDVGDHVVLREIPAEILCGTMPYYGVPQSTMRALVGRCFTVYATGCHNKVRYVALQSINSIPLCYFWPIQCVVHVVANERDVKSGDTVFDKGSGSQYEVQANLRSSEAISFKRIKDMPYVAQGATGPRQGRFLAPGELERLASGADMVEAAALAKLDEAEAPSPKNSKFWMLKAENGGPPVFQHSTLAAAETEAERLAQKLGSRIHVLECISTCRPLAFVWERN